MLVSNYVPEKAENRDISGKVVIETIRSEERNAIKSFFNICHHQNVQDHQHATNKWTPSTDICARDIASTRIIGRSEQKGNRYIWPTIGKYIKKGMSR